MHFVFWRELSVSHSNHDLVPDRFLMEQDELEICKEITEALSSHPTAVFFIDPVSEETDSELPEYNEIITTPMGLGTVSDKLEDGSYKSIDEWMSDIKLIWSNCYTYFADDTLVSQVARHLESMFEKYCNKLRMRTLEGWRQTTLESCKKIEKQLQKAPSPIAEIFQEIPRSKNDNNIRSVQGLLSAAKYLNTVDDTLKVLQLFHLTNIPFEIAGDTLVGNITNAGSGELLPLVTFAKQRCEEMSVPYPEEE